MTVPQENARWRKSTRSGDQGSCVELRNDLGAVRDSKNTSGPTLAVGLNGLLAAVKADTLIR